MSSKKKQAELREEKGWESIDKAVIKSESFLEKYTNKILVVIGIGVVIACGYLAYQHFYIGPKTEEAQKAIYKGQQYFEIGNDSLALYGDANGYIGFEEIAKEYGSTKTGNLAKAYAGICYAHIGKYDQALEYLKSYSNSGDKLVSYLVEGSIGDCLASQGKGKEAIPYFMKAGKSLDNIIHTPMLYKKAAIIYRENGDYDKVIELFTTIKNDYANSLVAAEADKYIEEATLMKGQSK